MDNLLNYSAKSSEKQLCRFFSLDEIVSATNNFDELLVIGKGGFGNVYKGVIDNGSSTVAIKRLNPLSKQGFPEFWTEIKLLSKFRHSHLVSLIGYCDQNDEMILVYEFMMNGSLNYHLHKISENGKSVILSWVQRLKICIGAARGLDYLHTGTGLVDRVLHRDVKSSNILLDENWAAKISDFGLSRIGPADQEISHVSTIHLRGTAGYIDPEYINTLRFTRKTDVYAFGVVLLEVLSERAAMDRSLLDEDQWSLAVWGQHCINDGVPHKLIGSNVDCEILPNSLTEFVGIAGQCLHSRPDKRPTMSEVVVKLELALSLQLRTNELMDDNFLFTDWPFGSPENTISPGNSNQIVQVGDSSGKDLVQPATPVVSGCNIYRQLYKNIKFSSKLPKINFKTRKIAKEDPEVHESPPGPAINFTNLGEVFTHRYILEVTNQFSDANLLKHGHSGDIFRGVLETGVPIVIKRINLGSVNNESYLLELEFFSKVSHPRLVPLLGHCLENKDEKFLIYKYMRHIHGDLSTSLFTPHNEVDDSISLDWITRLKIAIGAAEGLSYLHHECNPPLVHRDVQASSILLDDKFEVRLGSLSEACVLEEDTHQSRITRLLRFPQSSEDGSSGTSTSTCAYDVYCFGKVLLELVTGEIGISASTESVLKDVLEIKLPYISLYDEELVTNILDPTLIIDEDLLEEVWAMAVVARSCLNPMASRRPLMKHVLKALENPLGVVRDENKISGGGSPDSWRHYWSDVAAETTSGGGV